MIICDILIQSMKILLTVPAYLAYSYVNQAQALKTGFSELNIDNQLFKANNPGELIQQLNRYHPDYVIGVGNWTEFDLFVKTPATLGYHYLPWIVTDEDRITKYVAEYNQSGPIVTPAVIVIKTSSIAVSKVISSMLSPKPLIPLSGVPYPSRNSCLFSKI